RNNDEFNNCFSARVDLHVHGVGCAIRELPSSVHDHALAAVVDSIRIAFVVAHGPDVELMERAWRVAAVGHREEKRNTPGGLYEQAARTGVADSRGDTSSESRPLETDSDDDLLDHRRFDSDGDWHRSGLGAALGDCGDDHRRVRGGGAVAAAPRAADP